MKTIAAIPCYNEGLAIGSVVLKASRYVDEVLVVDDGSIDDTVEVAEAAGCYGRCTWYEQGLWCCDTVVFRICEAAQFRHNDHSGFCGNGQHDPSNIPDFITAMRTNEADVVIGSRFREKKNGNGIPRYRIAGMKILNASTRVAGSIKTTDSQSGYRAYSRRAIEKITVTNPDMFICAGSEILMPVKDHDLDVLEIPITARYDIENISSKNPVSHGFGVLNSSLGYCCCSNII